MASNGQTKAFLRSGELARLAGVSSDTLRHYERKGLLPAPRRSSNGYRQYTASTLDRVRMIRRALAVGFTIEELAEILRERDRGGAPCRRVRAAAEAKLAEVEARLQEIEALRDELQAILRDWDRRLEGAKAGERAGLLEALRSRDGHREDELSPLAPPAIRRRNRRKNQ